MLPLPGGAAVFRVLPLRQAWHENEPCLNDGGASLFIAYIQRRPWLFAACVSQQFLAVVCAGSAVLEIGEDILRTPRTLKLTLVPRNISSLGLKGKPRRLAQGLRPQTAAWQARQLQRVLESRGLSPTARRGGDRIGVDSSGSGRLLQPREPHNNMLANKHELCQWCF